LTSHLNCKSIEDQLDLQNSVQNATKLKINLPKPVLDLFNNLLSSFHWEDIPLAVLRCDVFGDTLDVERAMKDILQWPAMKITQSDLDKSLKNLPSIKVDYTSGESAAKCTDDKYTKNIIFSQFLHNDKTVNFNTSLIPLDTLRQSELGCLLRGSNLDPSYIPSSGPIYKEEATKK